MKKRILIFDLLMQNMDELKEHIESDNYDDDFLNENKIEHDLLENLYNKRAFLIGKRKNINLKKSKNILGKIIFCFKKLYFNCVFFYKIVNIDKYFKLFLLKIEILYKVRNIDILTNLACQNSVDCSKKLNNKSYDRSELLDIKKDYDFYNNKFHKLIKERSRLAFSFGENKLKNGFIYFRLFLLEIKTKIIIFKNYE